MANYFFSAPPIQAEEAQEAGVSDETAMIILGVGIVAISMAIMVLAYVASIAKKYMEIVIIAAVVSFVMINLQPALLLLIKGAVSINTLGPLLMRVKEGLAVVM